MFCPIRLFSRPLDKYNKYKRENRAIFMINLVRFPVVQATTTQVIMLDIKYIHICAHSSSCLARLVGLLPGVMMRRASTRVMAVRWLSTTHGSARTYQ